VTVDTAFSLVPRAPDTAGEVVVLDVEGIAVALVNVDGTAVCLR